MMLIEQEGKDEERQDFEVGKENLIQAYHHHQVFLTHLEVLPFFILSLLFNQHHW
jgi:hypothetical protein